MSGASFPGAHPAPDFTAFDGDEVIGRVYQFEHGPERGLWFWRMTATRPGSRLPGPTNGRVKSRAEAGRCVVEAYRALLADARCGAHPKGIIMRNYVLKPAIALTLIGLPLAACQTGAATGAAGGAVVGAVAGGPVGAAVGGVAGAAVGGVLTAEEATRVRSYVVAQRRPSIRVAEQVVVGQPLPPRVRLYPVPERVGLPTSYGYTVVNERIVLIDPRTREVVQIIE